LLPALTAIALAAAAVTVTVAVGVTATVPFTVAVTVFAPRRGRAQRAGELPIGTGRPHRLCERVAVVGAAANVTVAPLTGFVN